MTLSTYNFLWGIIKFFLPSYLERRQKKGKEDKHRINERYGVSNKPRPNGTIVWLHGTSVGESVAALALANSMKKHGMLDPIYAEYGHHYGKKIKVIVGNNRMAAAKILGYKEVPIIINSYDPNYKPKGRELKSDDEIRSLFKLGKDLQIRRNKDGVIDQIMPPWYEKVKDKYV